MNHRTFQSQFLRMSNQFSKFTPLRDLLSTKNTWTWGTPKQQAFQKIKQLLSLTPVLAFYHPNRPTTVSADSSSYLCSHNSNQTVHGDQWHIVPDHSLLLTVHGDQWHIVPDHSLLLSSATRKLKKRCLLLHGLANVLVTT